MKDLLTRENFEVFLLRFGAILLIISSATIIVNFIDKFGKKKNSTIKMDLTKFNFIIHFINGLIYFIAIIFSMTLIPALKSISLSLFAGSGIIAVIIGFASQQVFSNIVSGIFIALFKPFSIGDKIKFIGKDFYGHVEDITLRHTIIRTFENKRVIVPNAVISSEIIENSNIIEDKVCNFIEISISYDSNIDKAFKIISEESQNHQSFLDNRDETEKKNGVPPVVVRVVKLDDSSINLKAWVWSKDSISGFEMKCDLLKSIKERFDKESIEIPFPHRTIVYKKES